jgi:DNA-binding SARP family transcriptional activator
VRLLGANDAEVAGIGAKSRAMLAYLAGLPGREAGRDVLADLLWDGVDARHALRQSLLVLRRQFDGSTMPIDAGPATISRRPGVETDLARFEALLAARQVEAACALWRGPFCAGLEPAGGRFDEWLAPERDRLAECAAGAFGELARQAEAEGRGQVAITAAQRLVALNPLDDAAQARLIALYRRQGSPEAARLAHRRCVGLYRRELGIVPGAEVQAAARTEVGEPFARPVSPPPRGSAFPLLRWVAAAMLLAIGLAWQGPVKTPMQAEAAPVAWVEADEWQRDAAPDTKGLAMPEAIARALAGDPEFAHLVPGGC